jgi:hypothetical protein
MARIPAHTLDTAPCASRPLLEVLLAGPGRPGKILNLQGQLAHAPVVLAAYVGIRKAVEEYATLAFTTRCAIQLSTSAIDGGDYSLAVNTMLARGAGWSDDDIAAIRTGVYRADPKLASLLGLVRDAAAHGGRVAETTWSAAIDAGWSATELVEAFIYLALTGFVDSFVNYAGTDLDVPSEPARA